MYVKMTEYVDFALSDLGFLDGSESVWYFPKKNVCVYIGIAKLFSFISVS